LPGNDAGTFEKIVKSASTTVMRVSMVVVLALMFLGAADVIGRYFFSKPIAAAHELAAVLLVAVVFFALAHTQLTRGHIAIEIFTDRFSPWLKARAGIVINVILIALFALMAWQGLINAQLYIRQHRTFVAFNMVQYPFQFIVPFGSLIMCLVLILEIVQYISVIRKRG
jgi:TRAP-type C4-dicarboxylate transport system permease small subunit